MPQAATERPTEVIVEFDASVQSLDALNAAVYRLIGHATCEIERVDGKFRCRLVPARQSEAGDMKERLLQIVADENVRQSLNAKTEPVRNLILALAFGSLAHKPE